MSGKSPEAAFKRTRTAVFLTVLLHVLPAHAGSSSTPLKTTIVQPLTITKTADLGFGRIYARPTVNRITINRITGARTASLGVISLAPGAPFTRALFQVTGAPTYQVGVVLPGTVTLARTGGGASMTVTTWRSTATGGTLTLNATGQAILGVGARLNVAANQTPGIYTGTFTITAAYQ
jgi:Domain of unknown function (DUF4402)